MFLLVCVPPNNFRVPTIGQAFTEHWGVIMNLVSQVAQELWTQKRSVDCRNDVLLFGIFLWYMCLILSRE